MTDRRTVATTAVGAYSFRRSPMAQPISTQQGIIVTTQPSRGGMSVIGVVGAGFGAAILLGALALWFHYGTAVFFEMIASGVSACF